MPPPQKQTALLVGLTHIDPDSHDGWNGRNGCVGCTADVINLGAVLEKRGCKTGRLLDGEATVAAVITRLGSVVEQAESGDCVFFYYSGHGGQVADHNDEEKDEMDETLICHDGHLIDDQLNDIWLNAREGVRIHMILDSCNSGTNYRVDPGGFPGVAPQAKLRAVSTARYLATDSRSMKARMLHPGGCRDDGASMGLADGGVFTKRLVAEMNAGFAGTWAELCKIVRAAVEDTQDPASNLYPADNNMLNSETAFSPAAAAAVRTPEPPAPETAAATHDPGDFPLPDGEMMLRRIDLAAISREQGARSGTRGNGIRLVAEGDSWFDFKIEPGVIDWLERDYGYAITNVAKGGACVYEMAYGPDDDSILDAFGRDASQLEEVVRNSREKKPKAFLFSGAGNDFAGPEFILAIHHAAAKKSGLNRGVVDALFREYLEPDIRRVVETATAAARGAGLGSIPVILHGYDHAFPDGRAAVNLWIKKIGPWTHPSFAMKGYPYRNDADLTIRRRIVSSMIDGVYQMMDRIKADYQNVTVVDVRGTLPTRKDWHDELHPSRDGFRKVAALFHQAITKALGNRSGGTRGEPTPPEPP
jgi:hypothetical protein